MKRYKDVSERIFEIFRRFTPLVEPLSLDEAFLDVTGTERLFGPPAQLAAHIKKMVKKEIGLTVSAGVAPNKLVAKIASDLEKPDGLTVVPPDGVREFLAPLPIGRLWGVGRTTRRHLELLGVQTFQDLSEIPPEILEKKFGLHGTHLARLVRVEDDRDVHPAREVKSMGAEDTFGADIHTREGARRELLRLSIRASRRMRRHGFLARTVTLKVKYSDFKQITRSETLPRPSDEVRSIYETVCELLDKTQVGARPVRLLGVSLSGLTTEDEPRQQFLFDEVEGRGRRRDLDRAVDRISEKFGDGAVIPATLLKD